MYISSGIPAFDRNIQQLKSGDNVVFRVDMIDDFIPFAKSLVSHAITEDRKIVYFRFATHKPVITLDPRIKIHETYPEAGFEHFITEIHREIENIGDGGICIFDCLSELSENCYSDRMI
jgi:hypothetical protein